MDLRRLGKALLFPPLAIMIALLPLSSVLVTHSLVALAPQSPISAGSYVIACYTLTVWCARAPLLIRTAKELSHKNALMIRWRTDARFRVRVSLYSTLTCNVAFGAFQLWLGFWHRTFWYYSLGVYYVCLAVMRFFLVRHAGKYTAGERLRSELVKYRACGVLFLVMNLALSVMIFFMVYWNRTFVHHEITTIAIAAYTFAAFSFAIVSCIRYRKYKSPIYSASKAISLASACVSMLTLECTMLTTFGSETMDLTSRRIMLGATGGAVSAAVIAMAVYMIASATKKLRLSNQEVL